MGSKKTAISPESVVYSVSRVMNIIGMVVLVGMMLLTVADVFLRTAFNRPIVGGTEVTEFMMVTLSLGMAWCILTGKSIRMELIIERFSKRIQGMIDAITFTLGLVALIVMMWQSLQEALVFKQTDIVSTILRLPVYPVRLILAFAFFLLAVAVLVLIVKKAREVVKG